MKTDDLDFQLPPELIAQMPAKERADSRLMHYRTKDRSLTHRSFADLPALLQPGDLLVFNDAQVLPARFTLQKASGGKIEGLFLSEPYAGQWRVLLKNPGPLRNGSELRFAADAGQVVTILEKRDAGEFLIGISGAKRAVQILARIGRMPLPPYIKRSKEVDQRDDFDRDRYQTIFAKAAGSVAAPTAGLHFTQGILDELESRGIEQTFVTLHVGMGTFKPVSAETLDRHAMHREAYSISPMAAEALNRAKRENRRIISVGTTATRVLESQDEQSPVRAGSGETEIFIYPPYRWKYVSALITNFHLPRSTLIALVAAKIGLDEQQRLYRIAIEQRYRFFSYGDAMFID